MEQVLEDKLPLGASHAGGGSFVDFGPGTGENDRREESRGEAEKRRRQEKRSGHKKRTDDKKRREGKSKRGEEK